MKGGELISFSVSFIVKKDRAVNFSEVDPWIELRGIFGQGLAMLQFGWQ